MTPQELIAQYGPREAMEYDVVIVGAGPAGLSTAIRLKQLAAEAGKEVSVVVLEKGSEPGAHILSGAVMDPRAINELLPNWKADGAPLSQPVTGDEVLFLSETGSKVDAGVADPRLHPQPRQLRHQPRQRHQVDGEPGRGAGRRDLPRLRRPPRCSTTTRAPSRAWPPATSASAATASRTTASSWAWSCTASTRSSPKARAAISASR